MYMTDDFGQHWTLLTDGTNGIPADQPMHVVREDPDQEGLLYAGTLEGAYVSFDQGKHWQPLQQNLPATPVTDIKVHHGDLVISTMGRSFWIMDNIAPLRQLAASVTKPSRPRQQITRTRQGRWGESGESGRKGRKGGKGRKGRHGGPDRSGAGLSPAKDVYARHYKRRLQRRPHRPRKAQASTPRRARAR